jgi:hypothetical protein
MNLKKVISTCMDSKQLKMEKKDFDLLFDSIIF